MKILYLITGLGLGGAEKVVANLADQMHLRGHKVKIAYLKGDIVVRPQSSNIELIYLGLENTKNIPNASKRYRNLIHEYQPDIVHAHMVHANIFARVNRLFCKVPKLICTAHSSNEGGRLRMLTYRYTDLLSNLNTNVSKEALARYIKLKAFTKKKSIAVYNGIDLAQYTAPKEVNLKKDNSINILTVGRLTEAKDYPNLLKAISLVVAQHPNIHFSIAGDGELKSDLLALAKDLKIEQYISFLGRRDDIPTLMDQADLFILPSAYEGFGLVVAEAMACETFVIATDCGGVKEVMGGNGILIPPKDSEALAQAILTAIKMPKEAIEENNQKALEHVQKNFDLNKIIAQWESIYESI